MNEIAKSILVVDDEEDVRLFLTDFLMDRDWRVLSAENASEALEIVEKHNPKVVLLDVMMPGMDGLECLGQIKKKAPATIVIMITALNDQERISRAKKLGAQNYILKPFSLTYLETELLSILEKL